MTLYEKINNSRQSNSSLLSRGFASFLMINTSLFVFHACVLLISIPVFNSTNDFKLSIAISYVIFGSVSTAIALIVFVININWYLWDLDLRIQSKSMINALRDMQDEIYHKDKLKNEKMSEEFGSSALQFEFEMRAKNELMYSFRFVRNFIYFRGVMIASFIIANFVFTSVLILAMPR